MEDIQQAVKRKPDYPTYTVQLANILLAKNKKMILPILEPTIDKMKYLHNLEALGGILLSVETGKFSLSKKVFKKLFVLNLKKRSVNIGLPLIYAKEGHLKKALRYLKYLKAVDVRNDLTQSVLRKFPEFAKLMKDPWVLSLPK